MIKKLKDNIISLMKPSGELSYANRFTGAVCLLVALLDLALIITNNYIGGERATLVEEGINVGNDYVIVVAMIAVGAMVWMYNSKMDGYLHTSIIFGIMIIVLQLLFQCMGTYSLSFSYVIIILTIIYGKPILILIIGVILILAEFVNYWTLQAFEHQREQLGYVVELTDDMKQSFLDSMFFYMPMTIMTAIFTSICMRQLFGYVLDYSSKEAVNVSKKNAAAEIQQQIIGSTHVDETAADNISFMPFLKTADYVAGDFYDYYSIDRYHICFMIADVSGKGMAAGLFMVRAKDVLKVVGKDKLDPAKVIQRANEELYENNAECMFASAWLGIIDLRTGEVNYTNAGHPGPVLITHNGRTLILNEISGPLLGLFPGSKYKNHTVNITEGDRILLYTDGVTEQPIGGGLRYEEKGLVKFIKEHTDTDNLCDAVYEELMSYGEKQFDDITMLQLNLNQLKASTSKIGKEINRKCILAAEPMSVRTFRSILMEEFEDSLVDKAVLNEIYVACEEMITNIIKYAYRTDDYNGGFEVIIKAEDDYIDITLVDSGIPFNPFLRDASVRANREDAITEGGRGIKIFTDIMDEYSYRLEDDLNIVTARKNV
ncbi:MAG: SpoIIE family protein phosphatase [Lachnospiraceae bacterium]|nr:SpoIIE family protein phosphatase [Lachnospiraceae bacterium]